MRKYFFQALVVLMATTAWVGCNKKDDDQTEDHFKLSGPASGTQERPDPVTTAATGDITGSYSRESKVLDYTITWNNLSADPVAMHFHGPAGPEESAPPVVPIDGFTRATSGTFSNKDTLTAEQETQLLGGKWYYNIHTTTNQNGEIRGQITATAD